MAITAAMKNVLSPISDARMTPHDFKNPSKKRFGIVMRAPNELNCLKVKQSLLKLGLKRIVGLENNK